jgi:hypothetical protein
MAKFSFKETIPVSVVTARLGTDATAAGRLTDADVGKFVKLAGDSRYTLSATGEVIEGFITSIETATMDGFAIGGVASEVGTFKEVTFDAVCAIGDYVVAAASVAQGTKLTKPPSVKLVTKVSGAFPVQVFNWRVVSLGTAGTGAIGTTGVIQRVS